MGINDPVVIAHSLKWGWMLHQGRETFYDENNVMRCWETMEDARQWAIENLGVDPIEQNSTQDGLARYEEAQQERDKVERRKTDFTDLPLFGGDDPDKADASNR
jgi:hypothetical protein